MEMTGCFLPYSIKNGCFILHNPLYSNSFPSLYSHELFDLIEAYRNPTYSYLQNNIINRYIHTVSEYAGKDGIANMSLSIYAYNLHMIERLNNLDLDLSDGRNKILIFIIPQVFIQEKL